MDDQIKSYADLARTYDTVRFAGRSGRFVYETDRRIVRNAVSTAAPRTILDIPTGTGRVLQYLDDLSAPITAVDFTQEMLERAAPHARPGKDKVLRGNAGALPFRNDSFDCVVSLRFFHLFEQEQRLPFAAEFSRVLRPGGHLMLSMTNGWYGGGINWMKRYLGMPTVQFEYRGEIRKLFPGWTTIRMEGNFLPLQGAVHDVPGVGSLLRWATGHFPANRLCWETYHLLRKP